jgi:hypothetical protein
MHRIVMRKAVLRDPLRLCVSALKDLTQVRAVPQPAKKLDA